MKRLFTILLFLVSILSLQIVAYAADDATLNVTGTVSEENKTITVVIGINSPTPFCGCSFNLNYDSEILKFESLENGPVIENATVITNENYDENIIRVVCASARELPQSGNVITVTFTYDISENKEVAFQIEDCKIAGANGEKIAFSVNNASVNIPSGAKNDSSGTGSTTSDPTPAKDDEKHTTTGGSTSSGKGNKNDSSGTRPAEKNNDKDGENGTVNDTQEKDAEKDYEVFLMSFSDVNENDWFYKSVQYVYSKKLMNGISPEIFSPNSGLTRAMLVTILYRMENEPECGKLVFEDVESDTWYTDSVAWAAENGIVNGIGNGLFAPNNYITREQIAVILYNYANFKNHLTSTRTDVDKYSDGEAVSPWAKDALQWAAGNGVINGKTTTTLEPQGQATRAEAATMLMRYLEKYDK